MKLFFAPSSPFVRKVLVCAHELALADRIETIRAGAHPISRNRDGLAAWFAARPAMEKTRPHD